MSGVAMDPRTREGAEWIAERAEAAWNDQFVGKLRLTDMPSVISTPDYLTTLPDFREYAATVEAYLRENAPKRVRLILLPPAASKDEVRDLMELRLGHEELQAAILAKWPDAVVVREPVEGEGSTTA